MRKPIQNESGKDLLLSKEWQTSIEDNIRTPPADANALLFKIFNDSVNDSKFKGA